VGVFESIEGGAMKTSTRRRATVVAAGVLGLGAVAVGAPALANAGPFGPPTAAVSGPGPGWRGGDGMGAMAGRAATGAGVGLMARDGSCLDPAVTAKMGTLTEEQRTTLVAMANEEKLAHDLYAEFAARYDAVIFDRIAAAESNHLTAVRTLLDRYGLTDPTADKPAGQFSDEGVQATYDRLLAQGQANQAAALKVGQTVEQSAIDGLRAALDGLTAPDVKQVYTRLLAASQQHLTAFGRWAAR
jgi:hypothetical protein